MFIIKYKYNYWQSIIYFSKTVYICPFVRPTIRLDCIVETACSIKPKFVHKYSLDLFHGASRANALHVVCGRARRAKGTRSAHICVGWRSRLTHTARSMAFEAVFGECIYARLRGCALDWVRACVGARLREHLRVCARVVLETLFF
jgi:hypothetical protein